MKREDGEKRERENRFINLFFVVCLTIWLIWPTSRTIEPHCDTIAILEARVIWHLLQLLDTSLSQIEYYLYFSFHVCIIHTSVTLGTHPHNRTCTMFIRYIDVLVNNVYRITQKRPTFRVRSARNASQIRNNLRQPSEK